MSAFWLSFCDPARPPGMQFLGACIVDGESLLQAVQTAHARGCNPGGEVKGVQFVPHILQLVRAEWRNRLLSREECLAFDRDMDRLAAEAKVSPPEEAEAGVLCPDHNRPMPLA